MASTFLELSLTYALLFRPLSRGKLNILHKWIKAAGSSRGCVTFGDHEILLFSRAPESGENENATTEKIDFDISQNPAKGMLDNFFRCSLPPSLQAAFNISQPTKEIRNIFKMDQHTTTQAPMKQILEFIPYQEDIAFMTASILSREFREFETFQAFPYFGSRLRQLKTYLDTHQPRTWLQLWSDDRDLRAWWAFWIFISCVGVIVPISIMGVILQAIHLARYR